jgi:serine/threonine protein kinase
MLVDRVSRATVPEDLFGELGDEPERALAAAYRRIARELHPDLNPGDASAARAFVRTTELRDEGLAKIACGTYGDRRARKASVLVTAKRSYVLASLLHTGDLADLYACSWDSGGRGLAKITRDPADNDLAENEARVLRAIGSGGDADGRFPRYFPKLIDSFLAGEAERRRVNVLPSFGAHTSLAEVRAAYPSGLDYRDVAWMMKRLLAALGYLHRGGFVHGAILPPHVLVDPIGHGAKIIDLSYAAPLGERVRAISAPYRASYAPEILAKKPATPATDIYMVAWCARALIGATTAPAAVGRFFATCLAESPSRRPDDAWALHDELDQLLRKLVGRPKYRPLAMPARA